MTDKQRLVYDLSMQCALFDLQRTHGGKINLAGELLDAFTSYVLFYSCMDSSRLQEALDTLKKI